ncbi:MAG: trigger factor [Candidatus Korobacteraceae bacterium]
MTIESNTSETNTADAAPSEPSNPCKREVTIEIPADVVKAESESVVNRYQKLARIPGFRKGKVPASIVRQRFAEEIKKEIVDALVPRYFRQETQKQNLLPVSQPRVTDLHLHDGEPLKFTAAFEVLPDFKIAAYEDLQISRLDTNVSEEDVENALHNLREQHATYSAVDEERPLMDADFAVISFKGTPKESEQNADSKPVEVDEVMVEIGGKTTIPEFTENLRGAKSGEQRSFEVKYADDFADKRLAGKTMTYEVDVKGIKTRTIPELNDEFAKELSADFNSLDELRNRLRENIKTEKLHEAEHQGKDQIVEELVKRNNFPVPEAMLDQQIDLRLERGLRALAAQGMRTEDMKRMDFARLRAGQREGALREVKASLILEQIADEEKIEVSDEEFDRELEALATQSKQTLEQVRARLTQDGGLDRIRHRIRNEKTLDSLYRRSA